MAKLFSLPKQVILSNVGALIPGARASFYLAGTTTPQAVYTTNALNIAHSQPVLADDDGRFPAIYYDETVDYKVVIEDSSGVGIYTQDYAVTSLTVGDISGLVGPALNPISPAETSSGVVPIDQNYESLPTYGLGRLLTPNSSGAASTNTSALQNLLDPSSVGPKGEFLFPNTTGDDTYYFNDIIAVRDYVSLNLNGCTLNFTKAGTSDDTNRGCFHAKRHFTLKNGKMDVNYTQTTGTNTFNAVALAGRDSTVDFDNLFDSLESESFTNINIENVTFDMAGGTNSSAIFMLGGINNSTFKNLRIIGDGNLKSGIFYEFGFATNEAAAEDRESSHAHNLQFKNIEVTGVEDTGAVLGAAIRLGGAYNVEIDGLKVDGGTNAISLNPGEAAYYRPWAGVDDIGNTRYFNIKNLICTNVESTVLSVSGAQTNTGYLSGISIGDEDLTDMISFSLDNFVIDCTGSAAAGIGMLISTGHATITNGQVIGSAKGIVATNEASHIEIDNVDVYDSESIGVQIGLASNIWPTARRQMATIRNSHIAGSGAVSANAGITAADCEMLIVENCRFGYETGHDGVAESSQTSAINLIDANSFCIARGNYVAGVSVGNAYNLTAGSKGVLYDPKGIRSATAGWAIEGRAVASNGDSSVTLTPGTDDPVQRFATTLTANRTVSLDTSTAIEGDTFRVIRTGLGSFTMDVGGLKTIPSATAATVDAIYDGTAWRLAGYMEL